MLFPSWRISLQILIAATTAFIGGVFALMITGQKPAWRRGLASFRSTASRGTQRHLLITHYIHLMKHEGEKFTESMILPRQPQAAVAGADDGTDGPVSVSCRSLMPDKSRAVKSAYPVATVILGGLFPSTFCEFLIRPGLFWQLGAVKTRYD